MLIQFETQDLRSICEDEVTATNALGVEAALVLAGLADLRSAAALGDLPPGIAEPGTSPHSFVMAAGSVRVMFKQGHASAPLDTQGNLDLGQVSRVKIIAIEDHA